MDTIYFIETNFIFIALVAFGIAAVGAVVASVCGFPSLVRWTRGRRWERASDEHLAETQSFALAENQCLDALQVLEKRVHYRHNVHCPDCGRFARQAEGWPEGVSDCRYHGIRLRVTELDTGVIPIVIIPTEASIPTPAMLEIEPPAPVTAEHIERVVRGTIYGSDDHYFDFDDEIVIWFDELEHSS